MDNSSPHAKGDEEFNAQAVQSTTEKKEDELPERQTRHSTRRRRSTGTSQSLATPSPAAALEVSSPAAVSPASPQAMDKPRSKSGRKPLSKGEQIPPILEVEVTTEDSVQEEKGDEETKETVETVGQTAQAIEETQDVLVPSHESTPAPPGRRDREYIEILQGDWLSFTTFEKKESGALPMLKASLNQPAKRKKLARSQSPSTMRNLPQRPQRPLLVLRGTRKSANVSKMSFTCYTLRFLNTGTGRSFTIPSELARLPIIMILSNGRWT